MNLGNKRIPKMGATGLLLCALLAVALLAGVACGGDDEAATAVPPFTVPTDLPSPEAVTSAAVGSEATAATTSAYWPGPKTWAPEDVSGLERVTQELVAPPFFPEHEQVNTGDPRVVEIRLEVEEKEIEIAPGVFMWAFTFNGSVPGPIIVVHEATTWR